MSESRKNQNPLFGRFDDMLKSAMRVPLKPVIGSFWGNKKLTFADMFCGIGGFHEAARSLGMECVFACDIDEDVRKIYAHNYKIKPESDICRIQVDAIPDHDILCAGFPWNTFL